ncbi:hypothetical protein ACLOJK_039651 [Asimina triloba]
MPSVWDYDSLQTLRSRHEGTEVGRLNELKAAVRRLLQETREPLDQLELIDSVERLGLGYHFEEEIKGALKAQSAITFKEIENYDLHDTALRFRLLRQHGYEVSQDVFECHMDGTGSFKSCYSHDTEGLLSLYEASHLSVEGETILDEAKDFAIRHLKCRNGNLEPHLQRKVEHALELPLHWRMPRSEIRWTIDTSDQEESINPILLELAKLDFNIVQATHQADVKKMTRWWKDLGLAEKLGFHRDRLMECFCWGVGLAFEPQLGYCRQVLTQVTQLITIIDDVYDVYGSLDELEVFTEAVEKWDAKALDKLPYYMQMLFLALYNTTNEVAYNILKEQGVDVMPYLAKVWADLCKSMLVEATWYSQKYRPTLAEYMDNGWVSISGPVILVHALFSLKTKEAVEYLMNYPILVRGPSMVFRLCNDLATAEVELERGDVPTSIQCYMQDANVSESVAREHIKGLIVSTWKKMNEEAGSHPSLPEQFIKMALNVARMAHCVYLHGDGHSFPDRDMKDRLKQLVVEPVPSDTTLTHV